MTIPKFKPFVRKQPLTRLSKPFNQAVKVVGAGLAGASIARVLAEKGCCVTLYDPAFSLGPAAAQTGHRAAAMTPRISLDHNIRTRLSRAGIKLSLEAWRSWCDESVFNTCGTVQLAIQEGIHKNLLLAAQTHHYPWAQVLSAEQASQYAHIPLNHESVWFPEGTVVRLDELVRQLLLHPQIVCKTNAIHRLIHEQDDWTLLGLEDEIVDKAEIVILACSIQVWPLLQRSELTEIEQRSGKRVCAYPRLETLHGLSGQVMWLSEDELHYCPKTIVSGSGYLLPAVNGSYVLGSTYEHHTEAICNVEGQIKIRAKMPESIQSYIHSDQQYPGWSGIRPVVKGRLPVIGELRHSPGIFVATAYASHGLTWAMLGAQLIASQLFSEEPPIELDLIRSIAPR